MRWIHMAIQDQFVLRCRQSRFYHRTIMQNIVKGWTNDNRMMITCCNDGTRPVIFEIERIDIPETPEEEEWLSKQNFLNSAEDAYTGEQKMEARQ